MTDAVTRGLSPSLLNVATDTVYSVKSASMLKTTEVGMLNETVRGRESVGAGGEI